ncbi:MAG: hypothetical protein JXA25_03465 [Anaerolineales bacterium]|nr:hypothetical protein [Anaerolineales bacterium]
MHRISPQLWISVFLLGALLAAGVLVLLSLYQQGRLHLGHFWGVLRMKFLFWHTEYRRTKGRTKHE